jgi:transposase
MGWEVLELSPARVSEQRRVQGRRRVKTDAIDLEAITELVLAGHGVPVTARAATVTELTGWAMQRGRRIQTRTPLVWRPALRHHGSPNDAN